MNSSQQNKFIIQVMHVIRFNKFVYPRDYFLFNYKMIKCMVIFVWIFLQEKKTVIGMCGRDNKSKS